MKKKRVKYEANPENLEMLLNKIDWTVRGNEHNRRIYSYENKFSGWEVRSDRVELSKSGFDKVPTCCFYFKDCFLEVLESGTVCLTAKTQNESVFVYYANYEKGDDLSTLSKMKEQE